jgi:ribosome-binding factor A
MGKERRQRGERDGGDGARTLRLQELIREEVNYLLRNEVRDPRLDGVEITMVELSGERARLWFTCEGDEDRAPAFERVAGFIRTNLADNLGLKRTPELRFRRDPASRAFSATGPISPGRT